MESIAYLDQELFSSILSSMISTTFERFSLDASALYWNDVELALHLLFIFHESIKGTLSFSIENGAQISTTPLGNLMEKMISFRNIHLHLLTF